MLGCASGQSLCLWWSQLQRESLQRLREGGGETDVSLYLQKLKCVNMDDVFKASRESCLMEKGTNHNSDSHPELQI